MPAWLIPALMFGGPVIQQVVGLFHKDDPKNPTLDIGQAPTMIMQNLLPMIMLMSMMDKDDKANNMLPLILMMQMTGINPTASTGAAMTDMQTAYQKMLAMQKQMAEMQKMIEAMGPGGGLAESPK